MGIIMNLIKREKTRGTTEGKVSGWKEITSRYLQGLVLERQNVLMIQRLKASLMQRGNSIIIHEKTS